METTSVPRISLLSILLFSLVAINALVVALYTIEVSRIARVLSVFILFGYFLKQKGYRQPPIFIAFVAILLRDILILDYETPANKTAAFCFTIVGYLALFAGVAKKVNFGRSKPSLAAFGILLLGLNFFNVYYLSNVVAKAVDTSLQFLLFFVQAAALLLLGISGYVYNDRYSGRGPLLFLCAVFSIILADCFGLAAYFYGLEGAYLPERLLYLNALYFLVRYTLARNNALPAIEEREYIL